MNETINKWIITTRENDELIIEHNLLDIKILINSTSFDEDGSLITVKYNEVELSIDEENKVNYDNGDRWSIEAIEWGNLSITHKRTGVSLILMLDEFDDDNDVSLTIRYKNSDMSITKQKKHG